MNSLLESSISNTQAIESIVNSVLLILGGLNLSHIVDNEGRLNFVVEDYNSLSDDKKLFIKRSVSEINDILVLAKPERFILRIYNTLGYSRVKFLSELI